MNNIRIEKSTFNTTDKNIFYNQDIKTSIVLQNGSSDIQDIESAILTDLKNSIHNSYIPFLTYAFQKYAKTTNPTFTFQPLYMKSKKITCDL